MVVGCRGGSRYSEGVPSRFWLLDFWCLGLWSLGFEASKIHQRFIQCFLEDIDPVSKVFKILEDDSSGFSVPVFPQIDNILGFQNFEIDKHTF